MSIQKYLHRLMKLHYLITNNATGRPEILARRLKISKSILFQCIADLKEIGFPIVYDKTIESYIYREEFDFYSILIKLY